MAKISEQIISEFFFRLMETKRCALFGAHFAPKVTFLLISAIFMEIYENEHFLDFGAESCRRGRKALYFLRNINDAGESFSLQNWKR